MSLSLLPQVFFPCRVCGVSTSMPDELCSDACRTELYGEEMADFLIEPDEEPELLDEEEEE